MDQSMRKSNSHTPRQPGSWGELNHLVNYNTPLTIITWAGQKITVLLTHWKSMGCFLGSVSYKSRLASWRHRPCAVLGLHQDAPNTAVVKQKSGRKIRPADQWTRSTMALMSDITEGQQRTEGSDRLASLLRLLCEPWQHWQSQIPKFASQNTNSDALSMSPHPSPAPFNTTQPTHDRLLTRLDFLFLLNSVSAKSTEAPNSSYPRNIYIFGSDHTTDSISLSTLCLQHWGNQTQR